MAQLKLATSNKLFVSAFNFRNGREEREIGVYTVSIGFTRVAAGDCIQLCVVIVEWLQFNRRFWESTDHMRLSLSFLSVKWAPFVVVVAAQIFAVAMPLLRKAPFELAKPPASLKPTDEVFFCEATKEAFTDYEEFFQRTILCNSLVWSCAVTGKSNLTFEEALESEEKARKR